MWGLDTLEWMNRPHSARESAPKNPLEALARELLKEAPPSIPVLVSMMRDFKEYGEFVELVKEFLPEQERRILQEVTPSAQMSVFADRFQDRYFPLHDVIRLGEFENYSELLRCIPVNVFGMSYEEYEDIAPDGRPAVQLLSYLFENAFVDSGERVSLAEACKGHVPGELLERVPEGGFGLMVASTILKRTRFKDALLWAEYVNQDTGNYFLDTDWDSFSAGYWPEWDKPTVEHLTKQWQEMEKRDKDQEAFFDWLEKDPPVRFKKLLEFMLERREKVDQKVDRIPESLPVGAAGKPEDSAG